MKSSVVATRELTEAEWAEVRAFGSRFFEGDFESSIRAKDELVLVRGGDGALVGMGAVETFDLAHEGRVATFIHAGNTAFDEKARGQGTIQRLGFRTFLRAKRRHPLRPVYLVYTTFSWRSYGMLVRNFARSWPRVGRALPGWEGAIYARLGERLLGAGWQAERGVGTQVGRRLKPDIARIPEELREDADLAFFAELNPGYPSGDVLLCLAPLDLANWLSVILRRRRR